MIYEFLFDGTYDNLVRGAVVLFFGMIIVLIAVVFDLFYAIKQDKENLKDEFKVHSDGLKGTIMKAQYYMTFIILGFLIDSVNPLFVYWDIPVLPVITIAVVIFLLATEFISVREHTSGKQKKRFRQTPTEVKKIIKEWREITKEIKDIKDDVS